MTSKVYQDESLIIDCFVIRRLVLVNNKILYHVPTLFKVMGITDLEKFKEMFIDITALGINPLILSDRLNPLILSDRLNVNNEDYIDGINLKLLAPNVDPAHMYLFTKLLDMSK